MALDALLAALEQEADARVAAILSEAHAQADRIIAEAEAGVARGREHALSGAGALVQSAQDARLAQLRRAVRGDVMCARAAMLERVFERARMLFPDAVCDAAFRTALRDHLDQAMAYVDAEQAVLLRCRPELAGALRALVEGRPAIRIVEDERAGWGIALQVEATGLEIDNTLEARLERARAELAIQLLNAVQDGERAGVE